MTSSVKKGVVANTAINKGAMTRIAGLSRASKAGLFSNARIITPSARNSLHQYLSGGENIDDTRMAIEVVRNSLCEALSEMNAPELRLMADVFTEYKSELKGKNLAQFYIDVQSLQPSEYRHKDQYQIYNARIQEYIEAYGMHTQKQAYSLIKDNYRDKSASRVFKKLVDDNSVFSVTFKAHGASIGYPTFQFDEKNRVVKPIVKEVLDTLGGKYKDWDLLFWFDAYNDDLECKPLEAIDKPESRGMLLEIADNESDGWA